MSSDINLILPVSSLPVLPATGKRSSVKENKVAFQEALQSALEKGQGLKISAHAEKRLKERNIILAQEDLDRISQAVRQAEAKGSRESLIIYGDLALVASVKNRTLITAMDGRALQEHVFTNIDSAVIVGRVT